MVTHTSAPTLEEAPHSTETTGTITISDALRRRAQSIMTDIWIDREWRAVIRYAFETNDPCLADLVRRADGGEMIVDTDFAPTPEISEELSLEHKISALSEIICDAGDQPAAALFVLMGTFEKSNDPKILANSAKHVAFARCADVNLYGMVDAQLDLIESELFTVDVSDD